MSYSKRTKRIIADDGRVVIAIDIAVGVHNRHLTRDEHSDLAENTASQIMQLIPNLRYVSTPLSKVKVMRL